MNVFLTSSPVEVISALACVSSLEVERPVFLVESDLAPGTTMEELLDVVGKGWPKIEVRRFFLGRKDFQKRPDEKVSSLESWRSSRRMIGNLEAGIENAFGIPYGEFPSKVAALYFNAPHDYAQVLLGACRNRPRVLFPHGFDQPRIQQLRESPFFFRERSVRNSLASIVESRKVVGPKQVAWSVITKIFGIARGVVPYSGTDRILMFRRQSLPTSVPVTRIETLRQVFRRLSESEPYRSRLGGARSSIGPRPVVLLLSEYNRHPIWEANRNWVTANLRLAARVLARVSGRTLVIKGHPRSDGTAAAWLARAARESSELSSVASSVELFPEGLEGLPIELLALELGFVAACSLGSCSLPDDIGIDLAHYSDPDLARAFDEGWVDGSFWQNYEQHVRSLMEEGICRSVASEAS